MFIMIGHKTRIKYDGQIGNVVLCPKCRNNLKYELARDQIWFTLFTVKVFPFSTDYLVRCPYCGYGEYVERDRYYGLLRTGTKNKIKVYR